MNKERLRVALVYGGRSAEREVSILSAHTVATALDPGKYDVLAFQIDAEGRWLRVPPGEALEQMAGRISSGASWGTDPLPRSIGQGTDPSHPCTEGSVPSLPVPDPLSSSVTPYGAVNSVDLLFPLLHGSYGEDGSIQGLARMVDLPCVGADILGSALCMDKDLSKRILREAGIPVAPFIAFSSRKVARAAWPDARVVLGPDLFVKPANLGSSVGVSRARTQEEYEAAVDLAFRYDAKILVEKRMEGREIEVAVLGSRELRASMPGEILPRGDFYSYEAKYVDESGAEIVAPATLSPRESEDCRSVALDACRVLCVKGMARVDMFLGWDGRPVVNEVNTIPGFTSRSMYPLLWEASGLPLPDLVDELISLALEAHAERAAFCTSPPSDAQKE